MKILYGESVDKKQRYMIDLPKPLLIELLEKDRGFHEVIDMLDPNVPLRIFFDIETYDNDEHKILEESFSILNTYFNCVNNDWAVSSCNRNTKVSYHFMSKKYKTSLNNLRMIANDMKCKYIDTSAYWFSMGYQSDEGSLRLPNQSKTSINKEGPPMKIVQGTIEDFFVSATENLELYTRCK